MKESEPLLDESLGNVFTQIADSFQANPEKEMAQRERERLYSAMTNSERQMAAVALATMAEKYHLSKLAAAAKTTEFFKTGTRLY